ncbi:Alpha-mannosidase 2x [Coemansia erecta]|uniref:Alpha-mannosidase 2x n=1 Tax=Coemansia erecta TaxID=147472 RepID=A0A9W8CMS3_9FUNG|nr:Alpha-mannosidase 2x [Coemansia erecta]
MRLPLLPRRYVRHSTLILGLLLCGLLLWANPAVTPLGKPSWAPWFGEPLPPTSRDTATAPLPPRLTLHLVPHSHSDIGWNLSFQGYYNASVHEVLRRVTRELLRSPGRRFTWGDLAFLDMWMADEGDSLVEPSGNVTWRGALRRLAAEGRMDVVGGTYVSPDEGLATWWALNSLADVGRRTHHALLGSATNVGWQIDPFGHFARMPRLLANAGFTRFVLGRMAYDELYALRAQGALQFLWQAPDGSHAPLLTHFLSTHYAFPSAELDFDNTEQCDVGRLAGLLRRYAVQQVRQYPGHGHIMVMLGDDFRYVEAQRAFACIDRLVQHDKLLPGVTMRYSTPSEYFASVEPHLLGPSARLHRLTGDMYPYQDKPYEQYWAGILASRPRLKRAVRQAEHTVQHAEALVAVARAMPGAARRAEAWDVLEEHMEEARKQVAIGYHHDAITGTCAHEAYVDYLDRLERAERSALRVARLALMLGAGAAGGSSPPSKRAVARQLAAAGRTHEPASLTSSDGALHVPASACSAGQCPGTLVAVSNMGLLAAQSQVVRLHVHTLNMTLVDAHTGEEPVGPLQVEAKDSGYTVSFVARGVPAMGVRSYVLRRPAEGEAGLELVGGPDGSASARFLEKNGWRVDVSAHGSRVRMRVSRVESQKKRKAGGVVEAAVVWHEMRQYFANPRVQASGAYVMHSFMLMYAVVFCVLGAAACGGLGAAWMVHRGGGLRSLGRPAGPLEAVPLKKEEAADEATRLSVESDGSGESLELVTPVPTVPTVQTVPTAQTVQTVQTAQQTEGRAVWPALAGGGAGTLLVYYVAQVADIGRLDMWTVGGGQVALRLILPAFLLAYLPSAALRLSPRQLLFLALGLALGTVSAMFCFPAWQSRPLRLGTDAPMELRFSQGSVCDVAHVRVDGMGTEVEYRLCADRAPLVEVQVRVAAAVDREVVEHFSVEQPHAWGDGLLSACRFSLFDGVSVAQHAYRRWTPVPGNMYPAVSHVSLGDVGSLGRLGRLTLHSRQPVGATCVRGDTLELLVHRSMAGNDFRGLREPLVDHDAAVITHYVDLGLGRKDDKEEEEDDGLETNGEVNAPPLAVLLPRGLASTKLAYWSALGDRPADKTLRRLRFVGVHASNRDLLNITTGAPPLAAAPGALSVYARILALPDARSPHVPVVVDRLFGPEERKYRVEGDWSIAPVSAVNRSISSVERIELLPGRQALFRIDLG